MEVLVVGKMVFVLDCIVLGIVLDCVGFLVCKYCSSKVLVFYIFGCNVFVKDWIMVFMNKK